MRIKFIKTLSLLLVIVTIFTCIPVIGFAENEVEEESMRCDLIKKLNLGLYKTRFDSKNDFYYFYVTEKSEYPNDINGYNYINKVYRVNSDGKKEEINHNYQYSRFCNCYSLKDFIPSENDTYCIDIEQCYSNKSTNFELNFKLSELSERAKIIKFEKSMRQYTFEDLEYCYSDNAYRFDIYCRSKKLVDSINLTLSIPWSDNYDEYVLSYDPYDTKFTHKLNNDYCGTLIIKTNEECSIKVIEKETGQCVATLFVCFSLDYTSFWYKMNKFFMPIKEKTDEILSGPLGFISNVWFVSFWIGMIIFTVVTLPIQGLII